MAFISLWNEHRQADECCERVQTCKRDYPRIRACVCLCNIRCCCCGRTLPTQPLRQQLLLLLLGSRFEFQFQFLTRSRRQRTCASRVFNVRNQNELNEYETWTRTQKTEPCGKCEWENWWKVRSEIIAKSTQTSARYQRATPSKGCVSAYQQIEIQIKNQAFSANKYFKQLDLTLIQTTTKTANSSQEPLLYNF